MKCPKCNEGDLEESDFYDWIGICSNLDCMAEYVDKSSLYFNIEKLPSTEQRR